jgi:hypothetical protein
LIGELFDAIQNRNLAIFAGAGLSIPAGYVDWKQLLTAITDKLGLVLDEPTDVM